MRKLLKALLVVLLFVVCFTSIMLVAYDYLYEYPIGVLDTDERATDHRYYKLVYSEKVDRDTTLYFTRSKNGTGDEIHFGTYDSSKPRLLANFFCENTSTVYTKVNCANFVTVDSSDRTCYLFGAITDENTVMVDVTFLISDDETKLYETTFSDKCFYYKGFDSKYAGYSYLITGYNEDGYATFETLHDPMVEAVEEPEVVDPVVDSSSDSE